MRRSLALVGLALLASTAQAQNTANVTATATVVTPLTLTLSSGAIDFPTVFPGTTPAALAPASGAKFVAGGYQTAEVDFRFTAVPASLSDGLGNSLGITFQYCLDNDDDATACSSSGNAATGAAHLINLAAGSAQLWLGATLAAVPANQAAGAYSAQVSLEVNYTGN
jgi:hypothetical protein